MRSIVAKPLLVRAEGAAPLGREEAALQELRVLFWLAWLHNYSSVSTDDRRPRSVIATERSG